MFDQTRTLPTPGPSMLVRALNGLLLGVAVGFLARWSFGGPGDGRTVR